MPDARALLKQQLASRAAHETLRNKKLMHSAKTANARRARQERAAAQLKCQTPACQSSQPSEQPSATHTLTVPMPSLLPTHVEAASNGVHHGTSGTHAAVPGPVFPESSHDSSAFESLHALWVSKQSRQQHTPPSHGGNVTMLVTRVVAPHAIRLWLIDHRLHSTTDRIVPIDMQYVTRVCSVYVRRQTHT